MKKVSQTGLERHESKYMLTKFSFWGQLLL